MIASHLFASSLLSLGPGLAAAAPLDLTHGGAVAGLLAAVDAHFLKRDQDDQNPDGSAGTKVTPATIGAIIGGVVGVVLLLLLLYYYGRMYIVAQRPVVGKRPRKI